MKLLTRLLREPLLHFLAIGGLIFLLFAAVDDTRDASTDVVVVPPERLDPGARPQASPPASSGGATPSTSRSKALCSGSPRGSR